MVRFEDRFFPILVQHWPAKISDDDVREYCERQAPVTRKAITDRTPFVMITVGGSDLSVSQRKMIAEWIRTLPPSWEDFNLGSFAVMHSVAARGALTALKWLSPSLRKVSFVDSFEVAVEKACEVLIRAKISVPINLPELKRSA